ncbi:unnamed protein product [Trifolium pratense]|uniref:Uncharacterized protein n=1 Tax=Trifolium pratense TaxID=57577 RepID=A0ACB0LC42_TRIPR|nr:unnamed protein product [Trifolium pratense]
MFDCDEITNEGIASALRERPGLRSLSFSSTSSNPEYRQVFATSHLIDSLVSLKSLTCLALHNLNISDELLNSIAREGLPLMSLDLQSCTDYSFNGIFYLLSKCQHIQHLGLESAYFLEDQHVVQLSSLLRDLVSINLTCCQLTKSALFTLANNCPSLSEINMEMTGENVVGNSDSLGKLCVYPQLKALYLGKTSWLSDESIIMFASIFPNLELLDLNLCNDISEGICEVLRKCYKLRHLNLAYCPRVKLHGLNFVVPKLEVLDLSNTKVDDETLYVISKNCPGLLQLLLEHCNDVTEKGVKHLAENCTQLRKIKIGNSSHVKDALFFTDIRKGLTCFVLQNMNISDELLYSIAREGLPLTRLVLHSCNDYSYAGIYFLLSKCQRLQHLELYHTDFLNDQHVVELSSFLVDLVSIKLNYCKQLTYAALFALLRNCPSLSEIEMENIGGKIVGNSDSLVEFGVYPQLKSLYLGQNSWLSDEIITMFASIFPNLQLLDLNTCNRISEGICEVLQKCCKIRHLNLAYCCEVKLLGMNFVVPNLEVLNLICTKVDDETLYVISKNCPGLLQLFLRNCSGVTEKGVKH